MATRIDRPRLRDLRPLVPARTAMPAGVAPGIADGAADAVTPPAAFDGRRGYDAAHLPGFPVPLPSTAHIADDVLPVPGRADARLDYEHFTVVMSRSRRLALFTAVNIDGGQARSVPRAGDPWALDGRIPAAAQTGGAVYENNDFDRGHLVRREDPNWGPTAETANRDTFHYTNCAPQLAAYNQRTWLSLEDYIMGATKRQGERASVVTGPVFRDDDPPYRGIAIPLAYWKVVAFVHDDGQPSATAYRIAHEVPADMPSLLLGPFKTYQCSIASIVALTGLDFGDLVDRDGFTNEERATGSPVLREIRGPADILV